MQRPVAWATLAVVGVSLLALGPAAASAVPAACPPGSTIQPTGCLPLDRSEASAVEQDLGDGGATPVGPAAPDPPQPCAAGAAADAAEDPVGILEDLVSGDVPDVACWSGTHGRPDPAGDAPEPRDRLPGCTARVTVSASLAVGDRSVGTAQEGDRIVCYRVEVTVGSTQGPGSGPGGVRSSVRGDPATASARGLGAGAATLPSEPRPGRPATADPAVASRPEVPAGGARNVAGSALPGLLVVGSVVVWMYRRLKKDDLLENGLRVQIRNIVRDHPGINASDAAERLGVAVNTVLYHADLMAEYDLLIVNRDGGEVRYFEPEVHEPLEQRIHTMLRKTAKRDVVELIHEEPGIGLAEAARRLDRDPSTVKHHVDALVEHGIVRDRGEGRSRAFELTERVRDLVARA